MKLKIVTPNGLVFDDEITGITARTISGDVRILKNHIDYVTPLANGKIIVTQSQSQKSGISKKGLICVMDGDVTVIAWEFMWE